jgi:hypothetical protein
MDTPHFSGASVPVGEYRPMLIDGLVSWVGTFDVKATMVVGNKSNQPVF